MKEIIKTLTDMIARKVWGHLHIDLQGGKIVLVEKRETIKPE